MGPRRVALRMTLGSIALGTAMLAGCSSDDGRDDPDADVGATDAPASNESVALLGVVEVRPGVDGVLTGADVDADFRRFDAPVAFEDLTVSLSPSGDTCLVMDDDALSAGDALPLSIYADSLGGSTTIGAGDTVGLSSPAGTLVELQRTTLGELSVSPGATVYEADFDADLGALPGSVAVDVPGDEFPAFAAVPLPDVEPFELLSPATFDEASPVSLFRWTPGTGDAYVRLRLGLLDDETFEFATLDCQLVDDGEFSVGDATLAELGAGTPLSIDIGRTALRLERGGEALLVLAATSEAAL